MAGLDKLANKKELYEKHPTKAGVVLRHHFLTEEINVTAMKQNLEALKNTPDMTEEEKVLCGDNGMYNRLEHIKKLEEEIKFLESV